MNTTWHALIPTALLCLSAHLSAQPQEILLKELAKVQCTDDCTTELSQDGTIIKVEAGTRLPLKFQITGSLLSIENEPEPTLLLAHETFYIKALPVDNASGCSYCGDPMGEEASPQFFFSRDKLTWSSFEEFFGGTLKASLVTDEINAEPVANLSLDLEFKR